MLDVQTLQQTKVVNTYVNRGLTFVKGEGAYLLTETGERYLDLMSNYGVNVFGYGHPVITQALIEQLQTLTTLHGSFTSDTRAEASDLLIKRCGPGYSQVYWGNSGAEAIEAALKFAVLATSKKRFIVCEHGYHGKTLGALSATAGEKYKQPFAPLLWDFVTIPFNDIEALEQALNDQTAAFIVEPIQGEGGIFTPASDYLKRAKELCSARGALLIIDEIQTGVGRTGHVLASQKAQVVADILCLGKGLAGGIPVGATVVTEQVARTITKHIHTSTFGGNPLACKGVIATLQLLTNAQLTQVQALGATFKQALIGLRSDLIQGIRGEGLMLGIAVKDKRNQLLKSLQDQKILVIPAGENVVRLLPSFLITREEIDLVTKAFQKAFDTLN